MQQLQSSSPTFEAGVDFSSLHQGKDRSKRMPFALPGDSDSLSDRQCYVRSEFWEVFMASEQDVASRHSKGAQKLAVGQVGIRCIHCSHLQPKDRAERAVCYRPTCNVFTLNSAKRSRMRLERFINHSRPLGLAESDLPGRHRQWHSLRGQARVREGLTADKEALLESFM